MLRIATRRSALARAQARLVGLSLQAACGADFELVGLATTGDTHPDRAVASFDSKGVFVDGIRRAVLTGDCHLAVHSYKDLPSEPAHGLTVGAVPAREDPRDVVVSRDGRGLAALPRLATVATSSARRRLQLLASRPDLQVLAVRGNLDTRLRKVADGEFDAVVIALAGLRRLYGAADLSSTLAELPLKAVVLEPGECLPAAGQGALAVECRVGDTATLSACASIDDEPSRRAVTAERRFLERVGGGCLAPVGALATVQPNGSLRLAGFLGDPGRRRTLRRSAEGREPRELGERLADEMIAGGGGAILDAIGPHRAESRGQCPGPQAGGAPQ